VCRVIERAIATYRPHLVTIACNTASTLVLPLLRARFGIPFVGTVPAIKLAAAKSSSRAFAVLATPGTIARDYTRHLIESFASDCEVTLVASRNLAALAEAHFRGAPIDDQSVREEIAPCFAGAGRKVDTVVLACTHYPLLRTHLERLAPWPVAWIDPAPAIAQRVAALVPDHAGAATTEPHRAVFTNGAGLTSDLVAAMQRIGLAEVATDPLPPSRAPAV
jgi:glutamate racemase